MILSSVIILLVEEFLLDYQDRDSPIMLKILPIMLLKNFPHYAQYLFLNSQIGTFIGK